MREGRKQQLAQHYGRKRTKARASPTLPQVSLRVRRGYIADAASARAVARWQFEARQGVAKQETAPPQ
jgi:hypothetical protein